ncbi:glutathione S-transferase T3-like [Primulina tabacum]|uniref:glutathione S-transferase T3-like n=1 Tax=Primulina tabacum TaxID=48773 RepID=UPI003F59F8FF
MDSSSRTSNYSIEEDKLLCHVYLNVSQNPIIGINQSKDRFWSRIEEAFNGSRSNNMQERNRRSMQCRMQVILRAVRKLCGCVSIIEKLKPSGASEEDILNRAKDLMMQDKNFSRGFKFDHVWPIMKDLEKFSANDSAPIPLSKQHVTNLDSSQSDNQEPESPMSGSQGINSFSVNLSSDENACGTPSQRPLGVKKSKLKKKREENVSDLISTMKEGHRDLINVLQKGATDMQQNYDIKLFMLQNEQKKLEICQQQIALAAFQEENKILYMDLTTIGDPEMRQMVQNEIARIMQKRKEERRQREGNTFGKFFGDFGGSGSGSEPDFPDY